MTDLHTSHDTQPFITFTDKARARFAAQQLNKGGIETGVRGKRGQWELFGIVPPHFTAAQCGDLAMRLCEERERLYAPKL